MKLALIGSTRFLESFNHWNLVLTKAGHLVYSVATATSQTNSEVDAETKLYLDALHMLKIINSEAVFLITAPHDTLYKENSPVPYVGESTLRELYLAELLEKRIFHDRYFYTTTPIVDQLSSRSYLAGRRRPLSQELVRGTIPKEVTTGLADPATLERAFKTEKE